MLQIGAGTGLIFILRWFWWRINAASEIAAMAVSFLVACYFEFAHTAMGLPELAGYQKLVIGVAVTTISWLTVTFVTKPAEDKTLLRFCRLVRVGGPGWKTVLLRAEAAGECVDGVEEKWDLPRGILCMVFGCVMVYSALFATGLWMYRAYGRATAMTVVMIVSTFLLIKFIRRKRQSNE